MFSRSQSTEQNELHIQFMLYIIREAGLGDSVKVPWTFFERKPLFQEARVELFPFSSSQNLASRLSVQM